jgi:hypothetical protein
VRFFWVLALAGCTKATTGVTGAVVAGEIVDAGCLAAGDGDVQAVIAEHNLGDAEPAWSKCLWAGGTVSSCGVPCTR